MSERTAGAPAANAGRDEQTARSLWFAMGELLARQLRFTEAADAFRHARTEAGPVPDDSSVLVALAEAVEASGEADGAFRAWLDAALAAPERLHVALESADRLLSPQIATASLGWLKDRWEPQLEDALPDPRARLPVLLFLTRAYLLGGDEDAAAARLHTAVEVDRGAVQALAPTLLPSDHLGQEAGTQLALARMWEAAGLAEEALRAVDRALDLGLTDKQAQAKAQRRKAELLLAIGRKGEAAEWFYEAGRTCYLSDQFAEADEVFAHSASLDPTRQPLYWYWADVQRISAMLPKPPYFDEQGLRRAIATWDAGYALGDVPADYAWAFLAHATAVEELPRFEANAAGFYWQAAFDAERTLALDPDHVVAFTYLSRYHRFLNNDAVAICCAEYAVQLDSDSLSSQFELAISLADIGDEGALAAIDHYRNRLSAPEPWAEAIRGYVLCQRRELQEAIAYLTTYLDEVPTSIWVLNLRRRAYQRLGRVEEATTDLRAIWELTEPGAPTAGHDTQDTRAFAAYLLDRLDEAEHLSLELVDDPDAERFDILQLLAMCRLARFDAPGAEQWFNASLEDLRSRQQTLFSLLDVEELQLRLQDKPGFEQVRPVLDRWRGILERARDRLAARRHDQDAALAELEWAGSEEGAEPEAVPVIAALAGSARLHALSGRHAQAWAAYEAILARQAGRPTAPFPEAREALVRSLRALLDDCQARGDLDGVARSHTRLLELDATSRLDGLLAMAATCQVAGRLEEARGYLREAFDLAEADKRPLVLRRLLSMTGEPIQTGRMDEATLLCRDGAMMAADAGRTAEQGAFEARLGLLEAYRVDTVGALAHFRRSIELRSTHDRFNVTGDILEVVEDLHGPVDSHERWVALDETLGLLVDDRTLDAVGRRRLLTARIGISQRVYGRVRGLPEPSTNQTAPWLERIGTLALESDAALYPQGGDTPEVGRMVTTDIPAIQARLEAEMGLPMPGVKIRAMSALSTGRYVLKLEEVPLARGSVVPDGRYCWDADACQALGLSGIAAHDPVTEQKGLWLGKSAWPQAERSDLRLLDPYHFMLRHLEALVRRHLPTFLGVQQLEYRVNDWELEADESLSALLQTLGDRHARLRLLRVLRELLAEDVPIRNVDAILAAFAAAEEREESVGDAVERIRLALRSELPGNHPDARQFGPNLELERALARGMQGEGQDRTVVLPRAEARRLVAVVSRDAAEGARPVLTVASAALRPFVRRLVADDLPGLGILAVRESVHPPVEARS